MSWSVLGYLRALHGATLSHREYRVLVAHALHADATGRTYVGSGRIATECGISQRHVQEVRTALAQRGYLRCTGSHRGLRGDYAIYALVVPSEQVPPLPVAGMPATGVPATGVPATGTLPPPATGTLPPPATGTPIGSVYRPNISAQRTAASDEQPGAPPARPVDLAAPGPPGDLPGRAADPYYAAIWLEAARSAGLLAGDVRLSSREQGAATRLSREAGGDRERMQAVAAWIATSGASQARRAREQVASGTLRWMLADWPELERLSRAGRATAAKRETSEEIEARLAREASEGGGR